MQKDNFLKFVSFFFLIIGASLLIFVFYPIVKYELDPSIGLRSFISPVPQDIQDLTKASNWFENNNKNDFNENSKIVSYTISIPSLKIKNATVNVGGEDLSQSLIQYPGTALPGKTGNTVIFGHSVLPQFFDPKNYLSIFSTLPDIKSDSKITIDYDGVTYNFRVVDKFEVLPTDIDILNQDEGSSVISLVTCVPPGDPRRPRRLIVRAKIDPTISYANTRS
ncbi:MAG: sortase [Candidatus Woesebacteria bacterium]|nr:MAG: sortase [Candidatus Woesebacteria bacterium]